MVKYSLNSQNGKFAVSLQYLKKEIRVVLHTDNHLSFQQVDFNTFIMKVSFKVILSLLMTYIIKHSQSTQINKLEISLHILKKEGKDGVHLLHVDKHQSFWKLT